MIYLVAAICSFVFVGGGVFLLRTSANKEYFHKDEIIKIEEVTLITRDEPGVLIDTLSKPEFKKPNIAFRPKQLKTPSSTKVKIYKDNLTKAKEQANAFNLRDILYVSTPSFRVDESTNSIVEEKQKQYPLRRVRRIGIDNVHTVQKLIEKQLANEEMIVFYLGENSDGIYHTTTSGISVRIWYPSMK